MEPPRDELVQHGTDRPNLWRRTIRQVSGAGSFAESNSAILGTLPGSEFFSVWPMKPPAPFPAGGSMAATVDIKN